jgi:transcriptional regulator with XRE-family HTH domain
MADVAQRVASRIRELRMKRGWSLEELAEAAGLSRDAVVRIEQGSRNPRLGTAEQLAVALGVALADVIDERRDEDDARIATIRAQLRQIGPELADRVVAAVLAFCATDRKPDAARSGRRSRRGA